MEGRTSHKCAPLTAEQKKYRRDNDLCLYCGDSEHKVVECFRCLTKRNNVNDVSGPETALSHKQLLCPGGASGAALGNRDETSKGTGLMALPRELRNNIYEELLYLDEFQVQQSRTWRNLEPSILSVSRQLSHEASEILYEKNGWVTVTAADGIVNSLSWSYVDSISGFQGHRKPVTQYENDRLSKSAILEMELQQDSDPDAKKTDLVIPLAAMPQFCRFITQSYWVGTTDLLLRFNCHSKENHQERLLGYLGQGRGLRRVDITSPEPTRASLNTILLMTHPYTRLAEILNTMSTYQESSEKELEHGRTLLARNVVQDGVDFADWWSDKMRQQMARLQPIDDKDLDILFQARAEMGFSSASLSLRLGCIKVAQLAIESVLERLSRSQRLSPTHKACAHYYMAQSFEALGWKNAALYGYLQALRLRPGYLDANAAVDQMESNLGSGTALDDARVKHNIDHVLDRFRFKSTHSAIVSNQDYKVIFRKFEGTAAEIRSVDRDSNGETDLVYMNPKYPEDGYDDDQDDDSW